MAGTWAAKCMTVSTSSDASRWSTRSSDWMSPFTNCDMANKGVFYEGPGSS